MIKCMLCGGNNTDDAVCCAYCNSKLIDQIKARKKKEAEAAKEKESK